MAKRDETGLFYDFQKLCGLIEKESSHIAKTAVTKDFFGNFRGDMYLLVRFLIARDDKRVYNIGDKQMIKHLGRIFGSDEDQMKLDLGSSGDMPGTARKYFLASSTVQPQKRSTYTLAEINEFLERLTKLTKEADQQALLAEFVGRATADDLRYFCKLVDKDLKINIGPRYVLTALHPKAFEAYKNSHDLKVLVQRVQSHELDAKKKAGKKGAAAEEEDAEEDERAVLKRVASFAANVSLMTPIKPMLAKPGKLPETVIAKCVNGADAEIKYDGERIQIHKKGDQFACFSRNLKPVQEWKVKEVMPFIPKACKATDVIFDGEILLVNKKGTPLPFGSLGIHKKNNFKEATVAVFIFDILYLDGEVLLDKPLWKRRQILETHVQVIPQRIYLSEQHRTDDAEALTRLIQRCINDGLEGLVVKDRNSIYEPAARHWWKMKKDYLKGMADSADLLVLGSYYGTGTKGGLRSVFLMGCWDSASRTYKTVCKVGNGFDDATIDRLQTELPMVKVSGPDSLPSWLDCQRPLCPDFVIKDPKRAPVWEIEGAQFTKSTHHTANGISIRFPRLTRVRPDKDWSTHTKLEELQSLYDNSSFHALGEEEPSDEELKDAGVLAEGAAAAGATRAAASGKGKRPAPIKEDGSDTEEDESLQAPPPKKRAVVKSIAAGADDGSDTEPDESMQSRAPATPTKTTPSKKPPPSKGASGSPSKGFKQLDLMGAFGGKGGKAVHSSEGDEQPAARKNGTAAAAAGGRSGRLHRVTGDVTSPAADIAGNKIIVNFTDDSGKWSDKGLFAAIARKWPDAKAEYTNEPPELGQVQFVDVEHPAGGEARSVANVTVMGGGSRDVQLAALRDGLKQLVGAAKAQRASLHVPHLANAPDVDLEAELESLVAARGVPVYLYTRGAAGKGSTESTSINDPAASRSTTRAADPVSAPRPTLSRAGTQLVTSEVFKGVVAAFSGQPAAVAEDLTAKVRAMGGTVADRWVARGARATTHLVCSKPTDEYQHVEDLGGTVVTEDWVRDSYSRQQRLDDAEYVYEAGKDDAPGSATPRFSPLPNVFAGLSIYLHGTLQNEEELRRYIVAYGGDIASDSEHASHVVTEEAWSPALTEILAENKRVKIIGALWVWDSINAEVRLPDKQYLVPRSR